MSAWQGAALAVAAACAHAVIDALRKHGARHIPPDHLVALVGVLDALLSCSFVAGAGREHMVRIEHFNTFVVAVLASSSILLGSKVLYQRAIALAPLSMTIPYLSFSPAMLLLTAYVILGEVGCAPAVRRRRLCAPHPEAQAAAPPPPHRRCPRRRASWASASSLRAASC
jgi:drug/metabolite transporter (DMT)-like permease